LADLDLTALSAQSRLYHKVYCNLKQTENNKKEEAFTCCEYSKLNHYNK